MNANIEPKFLNDAKMFLGMEGLSCIQVAATIIEVMGDIPYSDAYNLIESYQNMNEVTKQAQINALATKIQQKVENLEENRRR